MDINLSKLRERVEEKEPGGLQPMGSQRVRHNLTTEQHYNWQTRGFNLRGWRKLHKLEPGVWSDFQGVGFPKRKLAWGDLITKDLHQLLKDLDQVFVPRFPFVSYTNGSPFSVTKIFENWRYQSIIHGGAWKKGPRESIRTFYFQRTGSQVPEGSAGVSWMTLSTTYPWGALFSHRAALENSI